MRLSKARSALAFVQSALVERLAARLPGAVLGAALVQRLRDYPRWLPPDSIAVAFALNERLRALEDPTGANRWLHERWVGIFAEMWRDLRAADSLPSTTRGFTYLSMGTGTRNPYALPFLVFLAGATEVWLVEPEDQPPEAWRTCWGLQELVLRLLSENVRVPEAELDVALISEFVELDRLFFTPSTDAVLRADRAHRVAATLEEAEIPDASVDLLSSRSVLEHVPAWDACFGTFARIMQPGGVMYHDIDFSAHHETDPLALYRWRTPSAVLNERRLSDYVEGFRHVGFDPTVIRTERANPAHLARERLAPRFRRYADEDLLCTRAVLLARRRR